MRVNMNREADKFESQRESTLKRGQKSPRNASTGQQQTSYYDIFLSDFALENFCDKASLMFCLHFQPYVFLSSGPQNDLFSPKND